MNVELSQEPDKYSPAQRLRYHGAKDQHGFTQARNGREGFIPTQDRYTAQAITHNPDLGAGEPRYKSDVVLPSIENTVSGSGLRRNIIPRSLEREELITYPQTRLPEPFEEESHYRALMNEDMQPQFGRRRLMGGHHWLREEHKADGRNPEDRDGYTVHDDSRPNKTSIYDEQRQPLLEDDRIIMLPPKSTLRYREVPKPTHTTSVYDQRERQPDLITPVDHSEYLRLSRGGHGQPQSSRSFLEGAPLQRQQWGDSENVPHQGPPIENTRLHPLLDQEERLELGRGRAYPPNDNVEREMQPGLKDSASRLYESTTKGSRRNRFVDGPGRNSDSPHIGREVQYPSLRSLPDSWERDRADKSRQIDPDIYFQYADRQVNPSERIQRVGYNPGELVSQGPNFRPGPETGRVNPFGESRSSLRSRDITAGDYTGAEYFRVPIPIPDKQWRTRPLPGQILELD